MNLTCNTTNILLASLITVMTITGCNSESSNSSKNSKPDDLKNTPITSQNVANNNGTSTQTENTNDPVNTQVSLQETLLKDDWKLRDAKDSGNKNIEILTNLDKKNTRLSFKNATNSDMYFNIGCNTYSGQYTLSTNNELSINSTRKTEVYCAELDSAEKKLAKLVNQKSQLSLSKEGTKSVLTMAMADGSKLVWEPRVVPAYIKGNDEIASNLRKYNWILKAVSQTPENPDLSSLEKIPELESIKDKVKLSINGNRLGYTTGCHQQSAEFKLVDNTVLKLSNVSSNVMSCSNGVQSADDILDQIMLQATKVTMLQGETLTFEQTTSNPNQRTKFLTWEAVDKSKVDLKTSIDQFNWKLTNALKQNSPVDSFLSTIPELIAVKDKVTLDFSFTPAEISYFSNNIRYSAGCNSYNGKFVINQDDALNVSDVQMTEKACANATDSAETELNKIMKKGGKLVMTMNNNVPTLEFTAVNADNSFERLVWQGSTK